MTYSISRINLSTANAIRQGASLAFLAMEIGEIPNTGAVAAAIINHVQTNQPIRPVIEMVHDQWKSGAKTELVRVFGGELLRKILNVQL